jgi:hypothetical protein
MDIYESLRSIQMELKAPKDAWNDFSKFSYRSAESILENLKPLLDKQKLTLTMTDELQNHGERYYVKTTVSITDGKEHISTSALAREQETKKGMTEDQVTGSASSYARKYALGGLFAIDDTKDSDGHDNTKVTKPSYKAVAPPTVKKPTQDLATDKQRALISDKLATIGLNTVEEVKNYLSTEYGVTGLLTKDDASMVIDDLMAEAK